MVQWAYTPGLPTPKFSISMWIQSESTFRSATQCLMCFYLGSQGGKHPQPYVWRKMKDFWETVPWEWYDFFSNVWNRVWWNICVISWISFTLSHSSTVQIELSCPCMLLMFTYCICFSLWRTPKLFIDTSKASWAKSTITSRWRSTRNVFLSTNYWKTQWEAQSTLRTQSKSLYSVSHHAIHAIWNHLSVTVK